MSKVAAIEQVATSSAESPAAARSRLAVYVDLTKPRIAGMVLVAAALGLFMGAADMGVATSWPLLVHTLLGVALVAGGANALNQYLEAAYDARMPRTASRPIPSGCITPAEALLFGVGCSAVGVLYLLLAVNLLTAAVSAVAVGSYVFLYTPLKRVGAFCVYVGAVPGALPPVIGYAAAANTITPHALLLFAILFLWQLPHFLAIAWMYRDEYRAAGYPMLTVVDQEGTAINLHMISHTLALVFLSLMPFAWGYAGEVYALGAAAIGLAFLGAGVYFLLLRTRAAARLHLLASVIYLPALFVLMAVDAWLRSGA